MSLKAEVLLTFVLEMQRIEEEELERLSPEGQVQLIVANAKIRGGRGG